MDRVLSGIQPTGIPHLGNYLGAMKQFVALQEKMDCYFCMVNLHAITVPQNPEKLKEHTLNLAAMYLAVGLNPDKATIFVQSMVRAHSEAAWLLQCIARIGEVSRMIQYKEKGKGSESAVVGLLTYPILQASDILLYQPNYVPVGEDQKQHLELTKVLAERFNRDYAPVFTIPKMLVSEVGARIMGLDNPEKKMSKSAESEFNYITLLDEPKVIEKKLKRAVTDSENEVRYDPTTKPGVSNLLEIYSLFTDTPIPDLERRYQGLGYGQFKKDIIDVTIDHLEPIRERYRKVRKSQEVVDVLDRGAERASHVAEATLMKMKEAMGLL